MVRQEVAFPTLTAEQVSQLRAYGDVKATQPGDVLFQEGDPNYHFIVILAGEVAIVARPEDVAEPIAVHGPGSFLGELNMLTGQAVYLAAVVREAGEALLITPAQLREVIATVPGLSELILNAFIARRSLLLTRASAGLKIIGSRLSQDTLRLREFAARNQVPHRWLEAEEDEAQDLVERFGPANTPIVLWQDRDLLVNPSNLELARRIGLDLDVPVDQTFDLVVVGAGPGGLAASVYGALEGLSTVTVEAVASGGQAGTSSRIENYLGFPAGLSGAELASRAEVQALKFGARITVPRRAVCLERAENCYTVRLDDGGRVRGRSVIVATGAKYGKLNVPRLGQFEGAGVYYAATEIEARLCREAEVVVVGGGNSAGQAAVFLSQTARTVHLLIRGGDLGKSMSRYLLNRLETIPNIQVHLHSEIRELHGEAGLTGITVEDNRSGHQDVLPTNAIFTFIGASPYTEWLAGTLERDPKGFILTGRDLPADLPAYTKRKRTPLLFETSLPNVFAVGDVRSGSVKRVASAVGEGSIVVRLVFEGLTETVAPAEYGGKP